jgi:hypothetical protein
MSNWKSKLHNTELTNLVSNLRSEVGDVIFTWVLLSKLAAQASGLRTSDPEKDLENQRLTMLDSLTDKLSDELVARLSELGQKKVGRLNFHFASLKMGFLEQETEAYCRFVEKERFHRKRNQDISHKELPEKWADHRQIYIRYRTIVKAVALASRLMKTIDRRFLGPRSSFLWREMRRRRYNFVMPGEISYMLLPYIWLSPEDRMAIISAEMAEGTAGWKDMEVEINGRKAILRAYGEMGAIQLADRIVLLPESFVSLSKIDIPVEPPDGGND